MVETQIQSNRPSQTDTFAREVQYLLALRTGDLESFKAMVERQPDLLEKGFETRMTRERHYWPLGGTALHWAAVTGDEALLAFLLSRAMNVESGDRYGWTPLHTAVWMGQDAITKRLLAAGASPNTTTNNGHAPLHFAAMRNYREAATALSEAGARIDLVDKNGRTPMDWAVLKNAASIIEFLVAHGADQPPGTVRTPERSSAPATSLMETGIKIVDLFAPLIRGGQNGIFTPHSGVGSFVLLTELVLRINTLYGSQTICLGLDDENYTSRDFQLLSRDAGIADGVTAIFATNDSAEQRRAMLELALGKADDLQTHGKEVFFLVLNHITLYEDFMARLKAISKKDVGMTTVYFGSETAGAEPKPLVDLDAVITFDFGRAKRALYPAVDPINSRSRLLQEGKVSKAHRELAAEARRHLRRYRDLQPIIESRGLDLLPEEEDRKIVERAARLERFLTQPFHWTEPWTNLPGVHVPLGETLEGCRAILVGECDDIPEEAFYFVGTLEDAREKAKAGGRSGNQRKN